MKSAFRDERVTLHALDCAFVLQGCVGWSDVVNGVLIWAVAG
jgi:hypothetical protein